MTTSFEEYGERGKEEGDEKVTKVRASTHCFLCGCRRGLSGRRDGGDARELGEIYVSVFFVAEIGLMKKAGSDVLFFPFLYSRPGMKRFNPTSSFLVGSKKGVFMCSRRDVIVQERVTCAFHNRIVASVVNTFRSRNA